MSKAQKIILAAFTAWPFLYLILFMCTVFGMIFYGFSNEGNSSGMPPIMAVIFILHFLTMIELIALLVIYILHVFRTERMPQDKKVLWAVILFLGNMIAMPIYWYLYIWKEPKEAMPEQGALDDAANSAP